MVGVNISKITTDVKKEELLKERAEFQSGLLTCYTVLDLFSGIGGFSLGLERTGGFRTVAFCEIEEFPRKVLRKHWPDVPIFEDVRTLHASDLPEPVDVICGGYPCQPFSVAGKREGKEDDRHLWPEMLRLVRECGPAFVICENVAGHVSMGLDQVLSDLEGEGYSCRTFIIPACAVNAPHRRDRVWIVAYNAIQANREYYPGTVQRQKQEPGKSSCSDAVSPNSRRALLQERPKGERYGRRRDVEQQYFPSNTESQQARGIFEPWFSPNPGANGDLRGKAGEWITLPGVRARDDGLPSRVARLKALGNAVVPQIPELIGRAILDV